MGSRRWDFSEQLARFGPETISSGTAAENSELALREAETYCRWVAETHYENFQIASFLLPRLLRRDFHNIYAYCRWSDDLGDEVGDPQKASQLLDWWREQLDCLFAGEPNHHPVMRALAGTLQRHALPKQPFADLLSAFLQDQHKFRYDSMSELEDYCRRSADPVGRLVLGLAGAADDPQNLWLSDSICTGLQLANFCQDMRRDAAIGRIYAPRELWQQHGVTEGELLAGRPLPHMQAMLEEFVELAENYLDRGFELVRRVPRWLALDVRLFRAGGLAILSEIERAKFDVWTERPEVSRWRKGKLLIGALVKHVSKVYHNPTRKRGSSETTAGLAINKRTKP